MEFVLFPSALVLHAGADVMPFTIEFPIFPQSIVAAAIFIDNMSVSFFHIVLKIAYVFILFWEWDFRSIAML